LISVIVPTSYENPDAELPIPKESDVNVWVYDVAGRQVKRLYSEQIVGQVLTLRWDGTNTNNEAVPAGVYFVKARAAGIEGTTKVVRVR
jgi:flagellar hook assembly protein FlgD